VLYFASRLAPGGPSHSSPFSAATAAADRFNEADDEEDEDDITPPALAAAAAAAAAPSPLPSPPPSTSAREHCFAPPRAPGDADKEDREGALAGEDRAGGDESLDEDEEEEEEEEGDEAAVLFLSELGESEEEEAGARKPNAQGSLIRAGCVMACVCGVKASERVEGEEKRWLE